MGCYQEHGQPVLADFLLLQARLSLLHVGLNPEPPPHGVEPPPPGAPLHSPLALRLNQCRQEQEALCCLADAALGMKTPNQDLAVLGSGWEWGKGREGSQEQTGEQGMLMDMWG